VSTPSTGRQRSRPLILVVDDNDAGRYATARQLRAAGMDVMEAATGHEALMRAAEQPDLILLDVNLPDTAGFEVVAELKSDPALMAIPVVHLSATYVAPEHRARGLEGGADAYLVQPIDARELVATVRAVLRLQEGRGLSAGPELLNAIVTASPDAVFVKDLAGRYLYLNPAAESVAGRHAGEMIGRDDAAVFGDSVAPAVFAVRRGMTEGLGTLAFEATMVYDGGQERSFLTIEGPLYDAAGHPYATFGIARETTDRDRAEEEARQAATRFDAFLNATSDMAFLKDDQGRYVIVNAAFAALLQRPPKAVIGHTDDELLQAAVAANALRDDEAVRRRDELVVSQQTIEGRIYETRRFPVPLPTGGVGIGGYVRDVTDRIRAEEEVLRLNAELEARVERRTQELELANRELEAFSYSVSHDLRAPLRAIDGFSQILLEDNAAQLDDEGTENLARVRIAAQRMSDLIDDLLRLSRLARSELRLVDVDVSALATEIAAGLAEAEPERALELVIAPGLHAHADAELVRVVLENLLANSVKFTSKHATARIEVGGGDSDGDPAFFVRDDGAGFDPEFSAKMFTAFQRLHSPGDFPGTGIGLATVQRIIHRHHGRVWAEGEVEKGATVWFTLPGEVD